MAEDIELTRATKETQSRWATYNEVTTDSIISLIDIENEVCSVGGIPIISDGKKAYIDNSDAHTLIFGSTGSKKTRLFGLPLINILTLSGESFIATDPKGELYARTSGLAKEKGYKLVVLNFRDFLQSDFWNPLKLPYDLYHSGNYDAAIELTNDFVNALIEPQRAFMPDKHLIELAYSHTLAMLLLFIDTATKEQANIFNFVNFFNANATPEKTLNLSQYVVGGSIASINFQSVLTNKEDEKTFANVASVVSSMLNPFTIRKTLCQILSQSSFDLKDIGLHKTAIYIIVPDEKTTLHFLFFSFVKQTYEALISEAQQQQNLRLPIRVNFVLDEFCNIPTIPDMPAMVSAARSRNVRFTIMAQSLWQLKQKYKEDADTIKGNCENWVFLTSRELDLLKDISALCGNVIIKDDNGTVHETPLISVSELQRLRKEKGESLILCGRNYPFITFLPDIDSYKFRSLPPIKLEQKELPKIVIFYIDNAINSIIKKERPMPFCNEVYGQNVYYLDEFDPSIQKKYY
jgi:type IV secretion system protein VirD4